MSPIVYRLFAIVVAFAVGFSARAAEDFSAIKQEVTKRHDEAVKRLQDWKVISAPIRRTRK